LAASRSWTEAAVITTAGTSPIVSTAMRRTWRERVGLAVVLAGAAAGYSGTAGGRSPEGAALSLRLLAPVPAVHGPGSPGWRAEGAPLKPVQKVVTSESEQRRTRTNRASESLYPVLTLSDAAAWTQSGRVSGARRTLLLERHTSPLLSTGFRDISADIACRTTREL
jgi:hypothetical protein